MQCVPRPHPPCAPWLLPLLRARAAGSLYGSHHRGGAHETHQAHGNSPQMTQGQEVHHQMTDKEKDKIAMK